MFTYLDVALTIIIHSTSLDNNDFSLFSDKTIFHQLDLYNKKSN